MESVTFVNDVETLVTEIKSQKLAVVCFSAPWCGPCKMIAPSYAEIAKANPSIRFYKTEDEDVAEKNNIAAYPTIRFYVDGKYHKQVVGANIAEVARHVQAMIETK